MPNVLTKLNQISILTNNNTLLNKGALTGIFLVICFILYQFLFQTFSILIPTLIVGLSAFYFFQFKIKAQDKVRHMNLLLTTKHIVSLFLNSNEKFSAHRDNTNENKLLPWESLIDFYEFHSLPTINLENLSFLIQADKALFEQIMTLHSHVTTLCISLTQLQNTHHLYLEKINIWESKIRTMKGLREMQNSDLKIVKEKVGTSLLNYLMSLTQLIEETSYNIHINGMLLIHKIEEYERNS